MQNIAVPLALCAILATGCAPLPRHAFSYDRTIRSGVLVPSAGPSAIYITSLRVANPSKIVARVYIETTDTNDCHNGHPIMAVAIPPRTQLMSKDHGEVLAASIDHQGFCLSANVRVRYGVQGYTQ